MAFVLSYHIDRISSLTMDDWIELKTTLEVMDNEKFQCSKCVDKYTGDQREKVQRLMGCVVPGKDPIHLLGEKRELLFYKCPGNYFSYSCLEVIESHGYFDKGMMPYSGGLFDQPNKIIEAYGVVASYKHGKLEKEIQKQKTKARQSVRGRPLGK